MFTTLYLFAVLPILGGLLYLLAVVRMWRTSRGLAVVMLLFWPAGLYALVSHWRDDEDNIRVPMFASLAAFALWWGLVAWGLSYEPPQHEGAIALGEAEEDGSAADAEPSLDDKLRLSIAMANLPYRGGRVEIANAHATLDVPEHFRFVDRNGLLAASAALGRPGDNAAGWMVHASVDPAAADAWIIEIGWTGDGFIADDAFAMRTHDSLFAEAQQATAQLSARQGDEGGFSLVRFAEPPMFDAAQHSVTWVEEIAYAGETEHRLDCYAARLGRGGALLFVINEVEMKRQELCLRAVRLAAARTEFEAGQAYTDHSALFDHKAKYDLVALVSGKASLR